MTAPMLLGADGDPCGTCGAPLAGDQRYCLTCGTRRSTARLPFLEIIRHEESERLMPLHQPVSAGGGGAGWVRAAPAAAAPPPDGSLAGRARANSGLILGVGVLLIAMLIGVLVGSGFASNDNSSGLANQKPVVVSVGGGGAAPAAAAAPTTATDAAAPADTSTAKKAKKKSTAKTSSKASVATPKAVPKTKLKNLDKLSGKEYQKQIDKLGKNIAVGGKAPPKDNKAPAGGGDFEDIG